MEDNKSENDETLRFSKDFLIQTITEGNKKLREELKVELIEDITKSIEQTISDKLQGIQNNITELNTTVHDLKKTANDAYETSVENEKKIEDVETRMRILEASSAQQTKDYEDLHQREAGYKKDITELKRVIDDQINRSMRGNLVFFGLKEEENENYSTKNLVGNFIFEQLYDETDNVTLKSILSSIVRAHRSKFNPHRDANKGPRPIYVKFSRDDTANVYLKRSISREVSKTGVRVKQQYTKELQERVDNALKLRRELFSKKKITKAYVEYPATLKGIFINSTEYTTIQSF